jgi:hypothetical protein
VLGKDTVIAFSVSQLDSINKGLLMLDECQEIKKSLNASVTGYQVLTDAMEDKIGMLNRTVSNHEQVEKTLNEFISDQNKTISSRDAKVRWLKTERFILFAVVLLLTGKILL